MNTISKLKKTICFTAVLFVTSAFQYVEAKDCPPTEPDALGPFYKSDAPVRSKIGAGYILAGTVRSSVECSPVAGARIEMWQAGPDKEYDDAHRATLFSNTDGQYRLETHYPPRYSLWRPSHIHILVDAPGFRRLVTQHYPEKNFREAFFDLVLIPAK